MGVLGIVDKEFAHTKLVEMAKYRNRLVHFYSEIKADEPYQIIQTDLVDFDTFLSAIKTLLTNPSKFDLVIE